MKNPERQVLDLSSQEILQMIELPRGGKLKKHMGKIQDEELKYRY